MSLKEATYAHEGIMKRLYCEIDITIFFSAAITLVFRITWYIFEIILFIIIIISVEISCDA